jgi:hypothetical protein
VPEPGILLLLGLGLSAVGIGSRYIKKIGWKVKSEKWKVKSEKLKVKS